MVDYWISDIILKKSPLRGLYVESKRVAGGVDGTRPGIDKTSLGLNLMRDLININSRYWTV